MTQTSMQIKALIRNKADGDSDKAQILLRIYMMERFLERVSVSRYKNNFILKGGMLVSSLVGVDLRTTMDIDTTVRALPLTQNQMTTILDEIMTIDLQDGVRFEIQKVMDIMEGHEYEVVRFFVKGYLDRMWQTIKIDISTGDSITPAAIEYNLPLLLEKRDIELWAYNIETLLAEKLETIMSRAEGNTRMRDFYDIYILTSLENIDINEALLRNAFRNTCVHRRSVKNIIQFDEILSKIGSSKVMSDLWNVYRSDNDYVKDLTWNTVIAKVKELSEVVIQDSIS